MLLAPFLNSRGSSKRQKTVHSDGYSIMIRISYPSESGERSASFHKEVVRFGRGDDCDIRMEGVSPQRVSLYHGAFVVEGGNFFVVERDGRHGMWLNGRRVWRSQVRANDRLCLGSPEGPEIRILEVNTPVNRRGPPAEEESTIVVDTSSSPPKPPVRNGLGAPPAKEPSKSVSKSVRPAAPVPPQPQPPPPPIAKPSNANVATANAAKPQKEIQQWLARAEREISRARKNSKGNSSGQTMIIMAQALLGVRESAEGHTRRWKRGLWALLMLSVAAVVGLSTVIWLQQQRIAHLVNEKAAIDNQIQSVFQAMATETDEKRLEVLESRLELLMGSAAEKVMQVRRANSKRAQELVQPEDPLETEIRKILHSFNAETYAIPPIFKQALQEQMAELQASPGLQNAFVRKRRYWPLIQRALSKKQLPVELGYIAYTESHFDPHAVNPKSHASGMWQLMEDVARPCGITVRPPIDERFDAARSSDAAACYLSKLLVEFGEESFMLALASYNRGENGVRRALHKLAQEPGGFKKRDFWHLYRLKLLPEETRDYVPKVIAAAIILGNPEKYGLQQAD